MAWRPIETEPKENMAVLLYFANFEWRGSQISGSHDQAERTTVAFYSDGVWCEAGTGHDLFEGWRAPEYLPTHWMPLPAPPGTEAGERTDA